MRRLSKINLLNLLPKITFLAIYLLLVFPLNAKNSDILLQGFHWESHNSKSWWNYIGSHTEDISNAGFTMIWLPPSSRSASPEGYLPNELYNQTSAYGSVDELKNMISSLHEKNILVIADIVINHRVGTNNWSDFSRPNWGNDAICSDDEWRGGTGNSDSGIPFHAGRDIDHSNEMVQKSIINWMLWLKNFIGYDGWRYDYVAGYAPEYITLYNQATQPILSIGEFWPSYNSYDPYKTRNSIKSWQNKTKGSSAAFDFATKGILHDALKKDEYWRLSDWEKRPSGLIGLSPESSVTFIDNHDTGPSTGFGGGQNKWRFPEEKIDAGYAYILTHPGIPSVYWVHFFDNEKRRGKILKLMKLRSKLGINAASHVKIIEADAQKYVAIIDDKLTIKLGPGLWNPAGDWKSEIFEASYRIWTK